MYVDIDFRGRISIHDMSPEEALAIAVIIGESKYYLRDPVMNALSDRLLLTAITAVDEAIESEHIKNDHPCTTRNPT